MNRSVSTAKREPVFKGSFPRSERSWPPGGNGDGGGRRPGLSPRRARDPARHREAPPRCPAVTADLARETGGYAVGDQRRPERRGQLPSRRTGECNASLVLHQTASDPGRADRLVRLRPDAWAPARARAAQILPELNAIPGVRAHCDKTYLLSGPCSLWLRPDAPRSKGAHRTHPPGSRSCPLARPGPRPCVVSAAAGSRLRVIMSNPRVPPSSCAEQGRDHPRWGRRAN